MTELPPIAENSVELDGQDLRTMFESPLGEGALGYDDLRVTPQGSGLIVDVATGTAYVRGDHITDQGLYRCRNTAAVASSAFELGGISAAHATNPRIDQIIARVLDDEADASGGHRWRLEVLEGTATGGATLDNRTGAASLPSSAMLIADILVPATFTGPFVAGTHIRDRRPFHTRCIPPLLTDVDAVPMQPLGFGVGVESAVGGIAHASHDLDQVAALFVLPRRIVSATKIRWGYIHDGGTPATGSYVLAIFDASGRKIIDTGTVAFTGAGGSSQERSETITATTFDAGLYYVFIGVDTSAGACSFVGSHLADAGGIRPPMDNTIIGVGTGGLTVPTTLLALTDPSSSSMSVPLVALSVG